MTYEEIKNKLTKCEKRLMQLQASSSRPKNYEQSVSKLNILKESLEKQLKEAEKGIVYTDDEKTAKDLADDGTNVKLTKEQEGVKFSKDETKSIAKAVGKALGKSLHQSGEEMESMKVKDIDENSFEIYVVYKNNSDDQFSFYISNNKLHLVDFSFDKELVDVGIKPSGEAIVHVDVLANEFIKHFKSLSEGMTDQEFADAKEKDRLEKHPDRDMIKKIQALIQNANNESVNEAPYQTTYIKVAKSDYKKAIQIIDQNIDREYVNTDIVDDDGDGNVIVYFNFTPATTDHDRYNPDSDPAEFIYDLSMDLQANGINITSASHDIDEAQSHPVMVQQRIAHAKKAKQKEKEKKDEALDHNDPVLMKLRALKSKIDRKKGIVKGGERHIGRKRDILSKLQTKRDQVMRDMEQEAEPEGGPIADKYGDMLNKIDAAIAKAKGTKPKSYDDTFNEGWNDRDDLFTFGYDLDMIQAVVDHLKSNYSEDDYELHIGRGDTHPNAVTLKNPNMESDEELGDLLIAAEDQEETDYQADRETYKDYMEEDTDVGHQDDEPGMLKSSAFETAQYAAKLYKKLDKYDQFDGEVDFPHWWQSKLILARDYMSAAFHYLNSEEKQPAIDQLALESNIKEEYTKEKLLAYLGQADDAMIRTHDDKYLIIYNPKNGNDDNASMWNDDSVFAVDQDGEEHEVRYDQIDGLQLEGMKEQALGFNHIKKLGDKAASHIDIETRRDSRYTFGNRPYQDDQLRYQIAKKLGYNVDSLLEQLKEGTDLYDRNGIQITRFSGGKRGVMVQINYGGKYIHIPAEEFPFLARAMQSVQDDLKDLSRQIPRSKNINERLSGDAREAIYDLQNILDQAAQLGDEARQIVKQHFPNELSAGDAYDVFNFGSSSNRYDKTLETLISDIERAAEEDEEAGYASSSDPDSLANEGQASIKKQLDKINLALKQHKDKTIAIVRKDAKQRTEDEKAHIAKMADLTKKKKDLLDKYGDAVAGINRNQELDA